MCGVVGGVCVSAGGVLLSVFCRFVFLGVVLRGFFFCCCVFAAVGFVGRVFWAVVSGLWFLGLWLLGCGFDGCGLRGFVFGGVVWGAVVWGAGVCGWWFVGGGVGGGGCGGGVLWGGVVVEVGRWAVAEGVRCERVWCWDRGS